MGARDPPWSGTPALTFTQRHERAAEAPSPGLNVQPGSHSPEAALQQWKIFSLLASEEKLVTQPTWLRQVLGRGAALKRSSPVPSVCIHSPSSPDKNSSCPSHPLAGSGHGSSGYKTSQGPRLHALGRCCAPRLPVSDCRDSPEANKLIHKAGRENKIPGTTFIAKKQEQMHSKLQWPQAEEETFTSKNCSS